MLKDFKTEIKLFLIVALVTVVVSVGGIFLLKAIQPASPAGGPTPSTSVSEGQTCAQKELAGYKIEKEISVDLNGDGSDETAVVYEEESPEGCGTILPSTIRIFSNGGLCFTELLRYPSDSSEIQVGFEDSRDNWIEDAEAIENFWGDGRTVLMVLGNLNWCGSGERMQLHFFAYDGEKFVKVDGPIFNEISTYKLADEEPRGKEILVAKGIWAEDESHFVPHRFQLFEYEWTGEKYQEIELGTTKNKYPLFENGVTSIDEIIKLEPGILKPATENWQTYRNEEFGFEVKYPSGWYTKEFPGYIAGSQVSANDFKLSIANLDWATDLKGSLAALERGEAYEVNIEIFSDFAALQQELQDFASAYGVNFQKEKIAIGGYEAEKSEDIEEMIFLPMPQSIKGVVFHEFLPEGCVADLKEERCMILYQILSTFRFVDDGIE